MQTGARLANMAAGQRQRNEAAHVVGAVGVLRYAHAPEDHGAFRVRIQPGDLADFVGRDAADG